MPLQHQGLTLRRLVPPLPRSDTPAKSGYHPAEVAENIPCHPPPTCVLLPFMSAAAETPAPTTEPSRSGRLLTLVRKLINFGRELVATVRECTTAQPVFAKARFGTTDLALIFTRIAHGLLLANALEARVLRSAAHLDAGPRRGKVRSAPRAPAAPRAAEPVDAGLAHLPTAEQIAAEVRRRPIGAVIADICRDLGILPSHPLWPAVTGPVGDA